MIYHDHAYIALFYLKVQAKEYIQQKDRRRVTFTFIFDMGFWISGIVFLAHDYYPTDNLWVYCMGVEVGSIALAIIATFLYHCLDHGKLIDGRASKHPYQWGFL
jgi:hypothetical protein